MEARDKAGAAARKLQCSFVAVLARELWGNKVYPSILKYVFLSTS